MQVRRRDLAPLAGLALAACAPVSLAGRTDVRIGMALEPPGLDPTSGAAAAVDEIVYANVFEGLTRFLADGTPAPALARSWDISRDGLDYLFHLAPGVRFHDGAACDGDCVAFSLARALAEGSSNAQRELFAPIASVTVVDQMRVAVRLKRRTAGFLENLAWGDAVIVSPHSAQTNAQRPIGTGPFQFGRWARGALVTLERWPGYWGAPAALSGASFMFIAEAASLVAALFSGDVDGFADFGAPELLPLIQRDQRFGVTIGASQGETIMALNNARAPFDDIRVRRALCHAVNRADVIQGAMHGYGREIGSHFPPTDPAYVDLTGVYPYDLEAARSLLADAGLLGGFEANLRLPPTAYARRSGEIVAAQLRAVGVRVRIEAIEWAQWLEQVFANRDFDMTIVSHTEPRDYTVYGRNDYYFGYESAVFRAFLSALDNAAGADERRAALAAIQRQIAADAVNVFLFQYPKIGVWRRGLEGMWVDAPTQATDITQARWAAQ